MRPTIKAVVEVGQIRDPSGEIFVNIQTEPGMLMFDASLHPSKVMAVLAWVNVWGDRETSTVVICENATRLDEEFLQPRPDASGHWEATWRSDKAVVAPQVRRYTSE